MDCLQPWWYKNNGARRACNTLAITTMPFDKIDIDSITEERRKSVAKSIRAASFEELKKLGDEVFHDLDDPWRDEFFKFIEEHRDATIYHANVLET